LQIVNSFRCFHWRAGHDACAPGLRAQSLGELRCEFFQFIDVGRLADQCESQGADLSKVAVIDLKAFDRFEPARQEVEHFAVEFYPCD